MSDRRHLPLVPLPEPTSRRAGPRDRGLLTVTGGVDAGRLISVPEGLVVTLGRSPEVSVQLSDESLSRAHARLASVGGEHTITDCGSTNGTYVNDRRILDVVRLKDGDRVQLGASTVLRFSLVDAAEERALRGVQEAGTKDALTGIANRRTLDERLAHEIALAARHGDELSVIMLDVDHFKRVNDTHGHLAGDAVLRALARAVEEVLRAGDFVARYGGEEFVVVARGVDVVHARAIADRVRLWITELVVPFDGEELRVTVSAGVASLACCGASPGREKLLALADERLYRAKRLGRNRVVGAEPAEGP